MKIKRPSDGDNESSFSLPNSEIFGNLPPQDLEALNQAESGLF